jgi:TonB-linked SusC/RagA family outer membrane protein
MSDRQNPVRVIDDNKQNHKDMLRLFGDVNLDFEIIKDLHFRSMLGMDYSFSWERNMQLTYKSGFLSESVARLNNYNNLWGNWVWSNTLNYNFDLGKSKFDLLAGQEMIDYYSEWTQAGREGYTSEDPDYMYLDAGEKNKTNSGSATAYRLLSYFGKVNYSFDSRYLASFTIRYDGSSRFGSNNRFGTFPAFSLGWRLSEEAFMESTRSVVSDLKLRYGWGKTGNQEIGDFASYGLYEALYGSDPTWNPDNGTAYDIAGNGVGSLPSGYRRIQQANPNLRWETATQNNIGLDFGFWDQKLFGSFDYFMKTTEDILIKPPYIATLGEGGDRWVNGATLDNKGYEFILSYVGKQGDFKYEVTGNIAGYRNKVVKLPDDVINSYPGNGTDQTILGRPLNSMFGYIADGIFRTQEEVDAHAAQTGKGLGRIRYKNIYDAEDDVNDINDRDRTWLGVADPKFVYGLNFSLTYKLWDFSMFWNGIAGGKVYNSSKEFTDFVGFFGGENYGTRTLDAWTPQNSGSDIPALSANDLNWERRYSTYFIESSSYFKLRSLELGYRLSDKLCKSMYMQGARFYFLGENLLTIKKSWGDDRYTGIDPETPNSGYPIPFSLTFGVNVSF